MVANKSCFSEIFSAKCEAMVSASLGGSVATEFENYVKLNKKIAPDVLSNTTQITEPPKLADR